MKKRSDLTAETVRALLDYSPETGVLRWRARTPEMFEETEKRSAEWICKNWNSRYSGKIAGHAHVVANRYIEHKICINYMTYMTSHIVYLIMTGEHAEDDIDHINLNSVDNRWYNLRPATRSQNQYNKWRYKNNKSGFKGVHFCKRTSKWRAGIRVGGNLISLGYFATPDEAYTHYCEAARKYHGEFARVA